MKVVSVCASIAAALLVAPLAHAEWRVWSETDPMDGRLMAYALTRSPEGAILQYQCTSNGADFLAVRGDRILPLASRGRTWITFRIDDQEPVSEHWDMGNDYRTSLADILTTEERANLFASAQTRILFRDANRDTFTFDGAGAGEAIREVRTLCQHPRYVSSGSSPESDR